MADTEKITINLTVVDLGKIDMLVDEGFYTNRTDFIRAAIRDELNLHRQHIDQITVSKSYVVGVISLNVQSLMEYLQNGKMVDIRAVGLLNISDSVTPDLAEKTIASIQVWGKVLMPEDVRQRLIALGRMQKSKIQA